MSLHERISALERHLRPPTPQACPEQLHANHVCADTHTPEPEAFTGEPKNVCEQLMCITVTHRGWKRLWDMFSGAHALTDWSHVQQHHARDFMACARHVFDMCIPEHTAQHDTRLNHWCARLTGDWEDFLTRTLGVSLALWSSVWATPCSQSLGLHSSCTFFGGMYDLLLEDALSGSAHTAMFLRTDLYTTPNEYQLRALDNKVAHIQPFRVVLLIHRPSSSMWNAWVAKWESRGRSFLAWAADSLRMRMYSSQTEKERLESFHGPWELYIIDSGVHSVGSSVDRFMYTDAVKHLGKKTATIVWYPLPPAMGDPHHPHMYGMKTHM